ncbi:MAG: hypothetical protein Fur002_14220 [Anaerolineales bacterium]
MDNSKIIYLHGLESNSQSGKAQKFAALFPGMITPDFVGSFDERMSQLMPILGDEKGWTIIGSSFGGLMGAVFTCQRPQQVRKLILLAPALMPDVFGEQIKTLRRVMTPTVWVHGFEDDVVPLDSVRWTVETTFPNYHVLLVHDGHRLHQAFEEIEWNLLVEEENLFCE